MLFNIYFCRLINCSYLKVCRITFNIQSFNEVCPDGFEFFDKNRCVKLMTAKADKAAADTQCQGLGGHVLTSKAKYSQYRIETYLKDKALTDSIYLGMSKSDGQWIWDDSKATIFAERK